MRKVFEITNKYIIIATPLILFSLLSSIYMLAATHTSGLIRIICMIIVLFLMSAAFIAGWGRMIKAAVTEESPDDPNTIIKVFNLGVGEYFLSSCGLIICAFIFNMIFFGVAFYAGMHLIGDIGVTSAELSKAFTNPENLKSFLSGLSSAQLMKINMWNLLLLCTMITTSFLLVLYLPALFFNDKNPFKALLIAIRRIFNNKFFKTVGIYLIILVVNFIISILSALFSGNVIMNFIITIANFYFVCCAAVGVFYYYNNNFVNLPPGQIVDTLV